MQHSWQNEYLPKLEVGNLTGGDVAICGRFSWPDRSASHPAGDRVSFVAPLGSRSDLEWLLRGLALQPQIRHLILCGDDPDSTGESLVALWEKGLDEHGRIAGSRGFLSAEIDAEFVDSLRSCVGLCDFRERSPEEVASAVAGLAVLPPEREAGEELEVAIPTRTTFLSRKTTFPIFTGDVGDGWLQLLNLAMRIGTEKTTADGQRIAEALNAVVTIELPDAESEHPSFFDFNADDFERSCRRLVSNATSERSRLGRCARLHDRAGLAQLEAAVERLKASPDTRSGTVVLLDADDMFTPGDAPTVVSASFNVVEARLYGSFVLRSADVYSDWPLLALALVRLQRQLAERLGVAAGTATFIIHSAHLYDRDWDRALRVLASSFERPLPLQVDPSGIFLFGNDGGEARAMLLDHDASTIFWEQAFSDPEDLSWYIIDTMPWLLPQHIRYVGQECASLMRAIRESECYVQG